MAVLELAFYKGRKRLFNRLVAWWTRGPYSHCELIAQSGFNGGSLCWSSSMMDGGVRQKLIVLDPEHWDLISIEVTDEQAQFAVNWFVSHNGQRYDTIGLLGFIWRAAVDNPSNWVCSEALSAALGFIEPWRFDPNTLYAALNRG